VVDRSITIEMKRKRTDEKVKRLRAKDGPELRGVLSRKAARWAADNFEALGHAEPDTPEQLHDRAADAWSPLFTIADLAGGDWPRRARAAAITLTGASAEDGETTLTLLLADIRAAFNARKTDRLASEDLVAYLTSLDHRPWPEFGKARKPISKAQVASLVKQFGVTSGTIRLDDEDAARKGKETARGYKRETFEDAFARYLPSENVTTSQAAENLGSQADFKTSQGNGCDVSESAATPNGSAGCDVVTFPEPLFPENDAIDREERAAILEHEAGLSRAEAERRAGIAGPGEPS
jgi:hypothetical protein